MKRVFWALTFLLCLASLGQVGAVLCQDEVTVSQGEPFFDLRLGLQNTGWVSYEAYAVADGDAKDWVSPNRVTFGLIEPGQTKTETYMLMIPRDASPGRYILSWNFYGYSGSYRKLLFSQTLTITVVPARKPLSLLPIWVLVSIGIAVPLWYWTRRRAGTQGTKPSRPFTSQKLKRMAVSLVVVSTFFLGIFYASWQVAFVPTIMVDFKVETIAMTRSNVLTTYAYPIRTIAVTTISVRTHKEEDELLAITIRSTVTQTYQYQTTFWSTESVATAFSFETTGYQTLSQTYPTLWIILAIAFVGVSAFILLRIMRVEAEAHVKKPPPSTPANS